LLRISGISRADRFLPVSAMRDSAAIHAAAAHGREGGELRGKTGTVRLIAACIAT
jgi:hypothetical protein